jgi:hypothetical protein
MSLRMLPFVFPNRQWLDVYLCLEQNIERNIGHLERGIYQVTAWPAQYERTYTLLFNQSSVNYML